MLQQERLDVAAASYRKALRLKPDFPEALHNLGNALWALKRLDEAEASYRKVLNLRQGDAQASYHLAMLLLSRRDFSAGWAAHECRWQSEALRPSWCPFTQPQWRGEPAEGRTLLIHAELGLGHTAHFCRYASLAATRCRFR